LAETYNSTATNTECIVVFPLKYGYANAPQCYTCNSYLLEFLIVILVSGGLELNAIPQRSRRWRRWRNLRESRNEKGGEHASWWRRIKWIWKKYVQKWIKCVGIKC